MKTFILFAILTTKVFSFEIRNDFDECYITIYDNDKFDLSCNNDNFNGLQSYENLIALDSIKSALNSKDFCIEQSIAVKNVKTFFYTKNMSACL